MCANSIIYFNPASLAWFVQALGVLLVKADRLQGGNADVSNEMENVFHDRQGVFPVETMLN